jgi:hypothetical protein
MGALVMVGVRVLVRVGDSELLTTGVRVRVGVRVFMGEVVGSFTGMSVG